MDFVGPFTHELTSLASKKNHSLYSLYVKRILEITPQDYLFTKNGPKDFKYDVKVNPMFNITFFNRVNKIYSNDKPVFITFCILYKLSMKDQWRSTITLISVDLCFDLFSKLKKKNLFQCI